MAVSTVIISSVCATCVDINQFFFCWLLRINMCQSVSERKLDNNIFSGSAGDGVISPCQNDQSLSISSIDYLVGKIKGFHPSIKIRIE